MEAQHSKKTVYLSPFAQRRREMAHPVPTKVKPRSPPTSPCPVLSVSTAQNLSPKNIASSDHELKVV